MICKYIQATFGNFKTFFIFLGWRGGGGGEEERCLMVINTKQTVYLTICNWI